MGFLGNVLELFASLDTRWACTNKAFVAILFFSSLSACAGWAGSPWMLLVLEGKTFPEFRGEADNTMLPCLPARRVRYTQDPA